MSEYSQYVFATQPVAQYDRPRKGSPRLVSSRAGIYTPSLNTLWTKARPKRTWMIASPKKCRSPSREILLSGHAALGLAPIKNYPAQSPYGNSPHNFPLPAQKTSSLQLPDVHENSKCSYLMAKTLAFEVLFLLPHHLISSWVSELNWIVSGSAWV